MKKILLAITFSMLSIVAFSQIYREFSLPHTTSIETLNQFIGQRVTVPSNYGDDFHEGYVFEHFSSHAKKDTDYTIEKIKVSSQTITIYLSDQQGNTFKAKVDANRHRSYSKMTTCESFLLTDKYHDYVKGIKTFENHKFLSESGDLLAQITEVDFKIVEDTKGIPEPVYTVQCPTLKTSFKCKNIEEVKRICSELGKPILNKNNDTIATVAGVKEYKDFEYINDVLVYYFRNKYDNSLFFATKKEAEKYALKVGETFTHPRVKHSYKIVGIDGDSKYITLNMNTKQKKSCDIDNPEKYIFNEDLSGKYISALSKVEKPSNPSIRYGKTRIVEDETEITQYRYVDNVIDILIVGSSKRFSFILKNISNNSIKIIWNEAVFVDFNGSTSKIMHNGTKYSQREGDQPATTIIKGAKIEDVVVPTCNIRYSSILEDWVEDSMYPSTPNETPGQIRLMLPIQIKDVINEYVFVFDVKYVYNHPEVLLY